MKNYLIEEFDLEIPGKGIQIGSDMLTYLIMKNINSEEDFFRMKDSRISITTRQFVDNFPEYEEIEDRIKMVVFKAKKRFQRSIGNASYSIGRAAITDMNLNAKTGLKIGPKTRLKIEKGRGSGPDLRLKN